MAERLLEQYQENVAPGPQFDDGSVLPTLPSKIPIRLIAFFLPQYHSIAENDRWWGAGFTEWTNVTKTLPKFPDHYQPRLPQALGFYDLSHPNTLRRQADFARRYGIEGFCFHHYWFHGRRLLQTPLDNLLADRGIDLPFCINWANENWTRRWDGNETDVLMPQAHSCEDDVAFARSLARVFDDPRYIRISGRPLLMLYRPELLPNARATVERWREYFATRGESPFLLMPQHHFGQNDPRVYGMDGAVGFPPFGPGESARRVIPSSLFDPDFAGTLRRYEEVAQAALSHEPKDFRYFPGVCPSWDNTARSQNRALVIHGSTPQKWGAWLEAAARKTLAQPEPERIVFINAWNEWAEGAYLEPDRHFGHAYLAPIAAALSRIAHEPTRAWQTAAAPLAVSVERSPRTAQVFRRTAHKGARLAADLARLLARV
jgi:lipopolysaccharide biosynthesis protein